MEEKKPQISVVILCYRAEDFAPVFISRVKKVLEGKGLDYELVLVANYHENRPDRTAEIVRKLALEDARLTVVAKPKEGMMGWDMRSGFEAARGETIAVIDGDGQMPPEDVIRVYEKLISGPYEMAKTYRRERHDGLTRLEISTIYNNTLQIFFPRVRVHDANSKPKIFKREAYKKLNLTSDSWFIDAEIIIQASYLGFRIGEVPTTFFENPTRKSFIKFGAVLEFAKDLIMYRLFGSWPRR